MTGRLVEARLDDGDAFHDASIELTRAARNFLLDVAPGRPPLYELVRLSPNPLLDKGQQSSGLRWSSSWPSIAPRSPRTPR